MRRSNPFVVLTAVLLLALTVGIPGFNLGGVTHTQDNTPTPTAEPTLPTVASGALPAEITLTLAGFAVPREAYAEIIPLFQQEWENKTGQKVSFQESYQASGAQSRAIVGGFKADVAALSLESDITRIAKANLITHDWKDTPYKGIVSASVAVLAVRPGNPKNITGWADLAREGIEIITPNPATSGGAQWNLLAVYGAAKRGKVEGVEAGEESAFAFLSKVISNISVLDKDGRESFLSFERGIGDVAITYENEVYAGLAKGGEYEIIYPTSTILIENPIAYIDVYVDENGTRPAAEAFVNFTLTEAAQRIFAKHGFRPLIPELLTEPEIAAKFPVIQDVFTIEEFGGWSVVAKELFGEEGKISQLLISIKG